jgi:protein-disulfide isomerase
MIVVRKAILLLALCALAQTAPAQTASMQNTAPKPKSAFDKRTLEEYVRHLFLYMPNIRIEVSDPKPSEAPGFSEVLVRASLGDASEEKSLLVSKDGQKILIAQVYDIARNPFHRELEKLTTEFHPSMGTPGAPVVIVIFSDFQCGYCREEAKMLRENLLKEFPSGVRLYFKDFPLTQIHDWAMPAALAGRCVFNQDALKFWDYHDWIFDRQAGIGAETFDAKLAEFAREKNLDEAQLASCRALPATRAAIERSITEARSLGVNSTPTLFINGRKIAFSIKWPNLKQVIEFELGYQKTAQNAGEKCCEMKLPDPLNRPSQ